MACGIGVGARALTVARAVVLGFGAIVLAASPSPSSAAAKLTVLYSFHHSGGDGAVPYGTLVGGPKGELYGTTNAGGDHDLGTVFMLTPHGKTWTEKRLYSFSEGANGFRPEAGLIVGEDGALYGTTTQGGNDCDCGVIFKLTPPASKNGKWKYSVLYRLFFSDGSNPFGGVVMDGAGALYGTTFQGGRGMGTVFQLKPPAKGKTKWRFSLLHDFAFSGLEGSHLVGGLAFDKHGGLYGVTEQGGDLFSCTGGCGVVFKLTPPARGQTGWPFEVLHKLQAAEGNLPYRVNLVLDKKGAVYGTTEMGGDGFGTVFQLKPPAADEQDWTLNVLHKFAKKTGSAPLAGLLADADGTFYGTTSTGGSLGKGTIFKLKLKAGAWVYTMMWDFKPQEQGDHPFSALIADDKGALYATTSTGGASDDGAVVKLVP